MISKIFRGLCPDPQFSGVEEGRTTKVGAKERDGTGEVGKDWPAQLLKPSAAYGEEHGMRTFGPAMASSSGADQL